MMNNTCRMSSTEKKEEGNNKRSPIHNGSTLNLGWSGFKDTANMKLRQIQTRMYLIWKKQIKVISRLKCTQYSGIVSPVFAHVGRHALRYLYCNLSHCCIMPSYTIYILILGFCFLLCDSESTVQCGYLCVRSNIITKGASPLVYLFSVHQIERFS